MLLNDESDSIQSHLTNRPMSNNNDVSSIATIYIWIVVVVVMHDAVTVGRHTTASTQGSQVEGHGIAELLDGRFRAM